MKHNFKKILCVLLACLMVIPFCTEFAKLPQIWAASSDIVDIPDVNMKAALNSALNVEDSSADITKEQLESLTALKLTDSDDTHITDDKHDRDRTDLVRLLAERGERRLVSVARGQYRQAYRPGKKFHLPHHHLATL